ncbi:hypothetical protein HELRODRAFT_162201 [Helobdella robusta]|uniref:G-protein coupled receptors family 1 profile domain-containing protein n=1 Tax=Helobdella robusta TaxID=6412 RepID=T1ESC6_HELRO|nr:hypothetical protein HELRODRAFT_162201 [Helobdella robusta]ESN98749.1 hypothetical protein HELRODRAFT_162201 [Helobdella robusta]
MMMSDTYSLNLETGLTTNVNYLLNNSYNNDVISNNDIINDYTTAFNNRSNFNNDTDISITNNSTNEKLLSNFCLNFRFVVNAWVIGPLCLIGVIGNTVSLIILRLDRQNKTASMLLQTLALVDNLTLIMSFILLSTIYSG